MKIGLVFNPATGSEEITIVTNCQTKEEFQQWLKDSGSDETVVGWVEVRVTLEIEALEALCNAWDDFRNQLEKILQEVRKAATSPSNNHHLPGD